MAVSPFQSPRKLALRALVALLATGSALGLVEVSCWLVLKWRPPRTAYVPRTEYRLQQPPAYVGAEYFSRDFVLESAVAVRDFKLVPGTIYCQLGDVSSPHFHIQDNIRRTTDQPAQAQNRVWLFGGSTIFCQEVPDDLTIASHLQRLLNDRRCGSWRVENLGTPSMTIAQHLGRLRDTAVAQGDVVVFCDGFNDVYYGIYNGTPENSTPGTKGLGGVRQLTAVQKWLFRIHTRFQHLSAGVRLICDIEGKVLPRTLVDDATLRQNCAAVEEIFQNALREAHALCERRGARFVHLLQPQIFSLRQMSPNERWLVDNEHKLTPGLDRAFHIGYPRVQSACRRAASEGICSWDISDTFDDHGGRGEIFLDQCHVNHVGNRLVARRIFETVFSSGAGVSGQPTADAASSDTETQPVEKGARHNGHWSFARPIRPSIPSVRSQEWVITPIDAFIAAAHESRGLSPSIEVDPATLIARLSQDLLGLPPSLEEAAAFVNDRSADALERAVDRLLTSPRFGERMAQHWLDLVRYADTDGYSKDHHREVWMYRDFVIDSFNANKPFDVFTREQLAGDLLPLASPNEKIASGYNRLLMTSQEGCADPKEYTHRYAADRVRNVSTVWLGLTVGCAECHDHKFDPVTSRDFYRLAAFFADVQETAVGPQELSRFGSAEQELALARIDAQISRLIIGVDSFTRMALLSRRQALLRTIPASLISVSGQPRVTRLRPRGNWADDSGEAVGPGFPTCLTAVESPSRSLNRLDLAAWLTSPENPLVARVFVNRFWKLAFGRGLVTTVDNLGIRGAAPSHPELLDWLAVEFVERGWDVKGLLKLIVTSRTYRQSSAIRHDLLADPDNVWLARQNRFRLDAEFIRDHALAVSSLLSPKIGGRSVKPRQPDGFWVPRFSEKAYHQDQGEDLHRRGLYSYWCRNYLHPAMQIFDAPARISCTAERIPSSTPMQALVILNEPGLGEAARTLAARILLEGGSTTRERVDFAFRLALSRSARAPEHEILSALYSKQRREFAVDRPAAIAIVNSGESPWPADIDAVDLATWTILAKVILNLHETVTRK
jgi:hypothetical protein